MEKIYASPAREKARVDRNFHSGMVERGDIFERREGATAKKVIDMDDFLSYGRGLPLVTSTLKEGVPGVPSTMDVGRIKDDRVLGRHSAL